MEKILKRFLILPLFIFLISIKNVYAEDRYMFSDNFSTNFNYNSWLVKYTLDTPNYFPSDNFNYVKFLDNNYYIGFNNRNANQTPNMFIFKYKPLNFYYILLYAKNSSPLELNNTSKFYPAGSPLIIILSEEQQDLNVLQSTFNFYINSNQLLERECSNCSSYKYSYFGINNQTNLQGKLEDFDYLYGTDEIYVNNEKLIPLGLEPEEPEEPDTPTIPPFNFNNNKYFVPNYEKGNCVEILDKDTIRVFKDENTDFYIDYFINSNYISKEGQVDLEYEKHCSNLEFTDIRYYGNDLPQILFILVCVLGFTIGFPFILYKRFRKR